MPENHTPVFTNRDKLVLRELSENSRVSLTHLAKVTRCSAVTANKIIEKLTRELDIRFTLEVDTDRLGLTDRHIIAIKFDKKPDESALLEFFKNDVYAQDVYLTAGDFDLLVFAAADNPINYIKWETDLASNLSEYLPVLRPSEFVFPHLGFMPLHDTFVDFIREEMKTDDKDKMILRVLNANSRTSYREMSKMLKINEDTVRYRVFKLLHKGLIRRFTIAVQNLGLGYLSVFLLRYKFNKDTVAKIFPQMREHYMNSDEGMPLLNAFQFLAPMSGSYRTFGIVFDKEKKAAIYKGVRWHRNLLERSDVRIQHAMIAKPLKGLLPLRNLDAKANYRYIWR